MTVPPQPVTRGRRSAMRRARLAPLWELLRRVRRFRRLVVAVCAATATGAALLALAPPPPPTRGVLVAAHDVAPGQRLQPADVVTSQVPVGLVPSDALTTLPPDSGPLLAGLTTHEVVTSGRLAGREVLARLAVGERAVAVPLVDSGGAQLLRAGGPVELVVAASASGLPGESSAPTAVVAGRLLTAPSRSQSDGPSFGQGQPVLTAVVAVPAGDAPEVAVAAAAGPLPFVLPGVTDG